MGKILDSWVRCENALQVNWFDVDEFMKLRYVQVEIDSGKNLDVPDTQAIEIMHSVTSRLYRRFF